MMGKSQVLRTPSPQHPVLTQTLPVLSLLLPPPFPSHSFLQPLLVLHLPSSANEAPHCPSLLPSPDWGEGGPSLLT